MTGYEKTIIFDVWAEDKKNKKRYTLNLKRSNNVYLKNIELPGYNLFPEFTEEETNYTINIIILQHKCIIIISYNTYMKLFFLPLHLYDFLIFYHFCQQ